MSVYFNNPTYTGPSYSFQRLDLPVPQPIFDNLAEWTMVVFHRPARIGVFVPFTLKYPGFPVVAMKVQLEVYCHSPVAENLRTSAYVRTTSGGGTISVNAIGSVGEFVNRDVFSGAMYSTTPGTANKRRWAWHVVAPNTWTGLDEASGQEHWFFAGVGVMDSTSGTICYIGCSHDQYNFGPTVPYDGLIEEFRIYNRALTASERKAVFLRKGRDVFPERDPSLVMRYRMQGVGAVVSEVDTVSGVVATPQNGPLYSEQLTFRRRRNRGG